MIDIRFRNKGRLGNRMFRYMYLRLLQDRLGPSRLQGYYMPEWNLRSAPDELQGRVLKIGEGHRYDPAEIADQLNRRVFDGLDFAGYVQRLEYYPDRAHCAGMFVSPPAPDEHLRGPRHITIHVRGEDILTTPHRYYMPVQPDLLERIVARTGLEPVLVGQIGDDAYSAEIRRRFAGCTVVPQRSVAEDFAFIRCSTNIVLSVSSFSWLAAWLSETARQVHLPLQGAYHPRVAPDLDLLPMRDDRYLFYEAPVMEWKGRPEQWARVMGSAGDLVEVSPAEVRALVP